MNLTTIRVGDVLCEKKASRWTYLITEVRLNYWGDGDTGFQTQKMYRGNTEGVSFWLRSDELESIYELYGR